MSLDRGDWFVRDFAALYVAEIQQLALRDRPVADAAVFDEGEVAMQLAILFAIVSA